MRQLTREEKEVLKEKLNRRLNEEARQIIDSAWEDAAGRCRDSLAEIFFELMLDKTLDIIGVTGSTGDETELITSQAPETCKPARSERENADARNPGYVYLYCVAPVEAAMLFKDEIIVGLPDGGRVRGIECGRLAAIVSSVPAEKYNEEALEESVQDPQWLESRVTGHEQIIQYVMKSFPVIPMKFCTIFHAPERINQLITEREDEFGKILAGIDGKEEWGLKMYYNPGVLRKHMEKTSERIKETRERAESKGEGAAYFMRKKMDELIAEEVGNKAADVAAGVHGELEQMAREAKLNRLLGSEVTGRLEIMALNAVYFLDRHDVARLKEKVEDLSNRYRDMGFEFILTGPWPPYNFTLVSDLGGGGAGE